MELTLERPGSHHYIRSVDATGVRIADAIHPAPLALGPTSLLADWPPRTMAELELPHLEQLIDLRPEIVLLGTGRKQVMLAPRLMVEIYQRGIGLEVMTTAAACRTFNVLVSEGREVVAALMPL